MGNDVALIESIKSLCRQGQYQDAIDLTYACNDPLLGIRLHILCICAGDLDNFKR